MIRRDFPSAGCETVEGSRSSHLEVDIHCPEKAEAETLLKPAILEQLDRLPSGQRVMLKLTPPELDDLHSEFVKHPSGVWVVALSGGYSRDEANDRLRRNHGVEASISRALVEGSTAQQSDAAFDAMLDASIQSLLRGIHCPSPTPAMGADPSGAEPPALGALAPRMARCGASE